MTIRIGVVGAGSMGGLHARVVSTGAETSLAWVSDPDEQTGRRVAAAHGSEWIAAPRLHDVDAVIVAAPTQHHFDLAQSVISAGLPLLLEKPLADTLDHSTAIVEAARSGGVILMCGLLERFNPAVRTAMEIARSPIRISTVRHSPYSARIRTGVASDLLIHDADLVLRCFGDEPDSVLGHFGFFSSDSDHASEDVVDALALFPGGKMASMSASRMSQHKIRSVSITEVDRLIDVDLLHQSITIYRNVEGVSFDDDAGYRQQTIIEIPVVRHVGEPLQLQLARFVDLIDDRADRVEELDSVLAPHRLVDRAASSARGAQG